MGSKDDRKSRRTDEGGNLMPEKGMTSKKFIETIEKRPLTSKDVIGLSGKEFTEAMEKAHSISEFMEDIEDENLTEFAEGWATKLSLDARKMLEQKTQMALSKLAEIMGKVRTREPSPLPADKERLRYIG